MVTVCHAIALKENNADEVCGIIKLTAEKKKQRTTFMWLYRLSTRPLEQL